MAQIQVDIQRQIATLPDMEDEQKASMISRLDEQLFSVTDVNIFNWHNLPSQLTLLMQLYSSFAAPLQLYEILLYIIYVADYRDPALTLEVWDNLLEKSW